MPNPAPRAANTIGKAKRSVMLALTPAAAALPSCIDFGREVCCSMDDACHREWLVTNGIGGFASGTISGVNTRRYHGLLIAALKPPLGRTLLVAKLEETAQYDDREYALFVDRWADGSVNPRGDRHLERFRLEGTTPVWTFAFADARLEKRIWMQAGENTTLVQYSLISAACPLDLHLKALVNYRDYHATTSAGGWQMRVERVGLGLRVVAFAGATPCDSSLRPNQIFAVSLPESALTEDQQRAVVDVCARHLLTSYGMRSLGPSHPDFHGRYTGGPRERDAVYQQGTVWGWLLGPFVLAHLRVYNDPLRAGSFLEPVANHMGSYGLGSAGEIFDGDAPFTPRGCISQAWTLGELLRAWTACTAARGEAGSKREGASTRETE